MECYVHKNESGKIITTLCGEDTDPPVGSISVPELWSMANGEGFVAREISLDRDRKVVAFAIGESVHFTFWNGACRTDLRLKKDAAIATANLIAEILHPPAELCA